MRTLSTGRRGAIVEMTALRVRTSTDMELVQRIQGKVTADREFRQLYERYAPATFAFFMRKVGNPDRAADLNQDLFLRLSKSIDKFEGRCSWRTWVFLIARTALAEERAQRWHQLAERSVELNTARAAEELTLEISADDEAANVLLRERLKVCIRGLNDVARAIVIGHYYEGVTLRELTERLGMDNPSGSRSVLIGAQRKLRRCLAERRKS